MKRDKLDAVFSKLIRERVDWTCEKCGKYYPEGHRQGIHCSHFFGRRSRGTRWHPDNCFAHCYSCHSYLGGHPYEFSHWAEHKLGEGLVQILRERAHSVRKYGKLDLEDMFVHYKGELARLEHLRQSGVAGRIEVKSFD